MTKIGALLVCVLLALSVSGQEANAQVSPRVAPWVFEIKGGKIEPDLDSYKQFYGDSSSSFFAAAFAYRPSDWYEVGGELGYMKDSGRGLLADKITLGGSVEYMLVPAHLYVNVFARFSPDQWVVPYAGGGVTMAWFRQEVDSQPNRSGRADSGYNVRAGVQVLLNRLDRSAAKRVAEDGLINTYLFLEGQYFSTEVDGIDLGGLTYMLGLRLEFDFTR
ncbi:MAG: outer membrane beta-barrel protein [Gammaproteobacteria bacterium]|jgi:opacity protein-like surface antigen|nr:hypothetical protein [Chromatiales bacterium]MCP4926417.1 outer membrane beta-barrel protein [Gammaproteobacteria bacterium]MDP7153894.1 outer membrane beta-barrel protein [Gammaproteobacteria bacterium]MDP7296610.1 outer membrane beta-barrel protein [Gammaproteobacteria bacterium]MDP7419346.1 outer membrane beta-barrel protein [Gammaproteobacteria bacterium]